MRLSAQEGGPLMVVALSRTRVLSLEHGRLLTPWTVQVADPKIRLTRSSAAIAVTHAAVEPFFLD